MNVQWGVYEIDRGAEVMPTAEYDAHQHEEACACGPRVEHYENGRLLIVHGRMDNRWPK